MKLKYVLFDIVSKQCFSSADMEGVYFSTQDEPDSIRYFDSEQEAKDRLDLEFELFPKEFYARSIAILPVFTLS